MIFIEPRDCDIPTIKDIKHTNPLRVIYRGQMVNHELFGNTAVG